MDNVMTYEILHRRRIVVVVTGGIAAYKSAELVRRLRATGAEVRVVMTSGAARFIGPLTMQALSGHPVHMELLDGATESAMGHIELARWAEAIVVAPATADFIARLRQGRADDLAAAICLASAAPLLVAPAMNQQMWAAAATEDNVRCLVARGVEMLGPDSGDQACGESGPGRMREPMNIVANLAAMFVPGELDGLNILLTAGPTQEPIDAVRFISNRSSGRMGYAIAAAARAAGAEVTLVSGPVALDPPRGVTVVPVITAAEMHQAVMQHLAGQHIFIATAAVADYSVPEPAAGKSKKTSAERTLRLVPTADILAEVARQNPKPFTVGFAAETDRLEENARAKLERKDLDMIAANWVDRPDRGFAANTNELHVYWPGGERLVPLADKTTVAREVIALIVDRYRIRRGAAIR
jgi:phosphopantothenoylcysteine decarboxylase/phosphopantothenate--cysteine ligase